MKNTQEGFMAIVIIVCAALILGGGAVYYKTNLSKVTPTPTETTPVETSVQTEIAVIPPTQSKPTESPVPTQIKKVVTTKDCGTFIDTTETTPAGEIIGSNAKKGFSCLIKSAEICAPAKVSMTSTVDLAKLFQQPGSDSQIPSMIQTQKWSYQIKGPSNNKCVFYRKLVDVQNSQFPAGVRDLMLKDGEMTCSYSNADLVVRLKNEQEGNSSSDTNAADTPAQKMARQCKTFGAHLDGSTNF